MERALTTILMLLCLLFTACTEIVITTESIEEWQSSPIAKRGYIYLSGRITPVNASEVIKKIKLLNFNNAVEKIRIVVSTKGGNEKALNRIIEEIAGSRKKVDIIAVGSCYGTNIVLLAAATGKRYALPNTDFILHNGKSSENDVEVKKAIKHESDKYEAILKDNANLPEEWFPLKPRWIFFTNEDAEKYDLVDEIVTKMP